MFEVEIGLVPAGDPTLPTDKIKEKEDPEVYEDPPKGFPIVTEFELTEHEPGAFDIDPVVELKTQEPEFKVMVDGKVMTI